MNFHPSPHWNVTCARGWQGGGLLIYGTATLTDTNVYENQAGTQVCSPHALPIRSCKRTFDNHHCCGRYTRCFFWQGGGVSVYGTLTMASSRLKANLADAEGANLYLGTGSTTTYVLPAPPGYWVPATKCEVLREACGGNDDVCKAAAARCKINLVDNVDNCNVTSSSCQPTTFNQPCDWRNSPALLGETVYVLPLGSYDLNYPFACAAGVLGGNGSLTNLQTSAACAGLCPAGFTCGAEATVAPAACPKGSYCPEGTSVALPCLPGSYSISTSLTNRSECTETDAGHSAPTGSTEQTPCSLGTAQPSTGKGACDKCEAGTYQPFLGGSECVVCGAGNYSSNVLSCEPCQVGEYCEAALGVAPLVGKRCPTGSTTDGRGATSKDDCGCYPGSYDASGSLYCLECTKGMNCTAANTRTQNLPVAAGYWRQHYWSAPPNGSLHACFTKEACLGGTNLSADVFCAPSQQGPYCAVCRDGYYGGDDGVLCEPCEGNTGITFLPMVIIGTVLLAVLAYIVVSCYRGKDILKTLADESSKLAEALAKELEDADASSTLGLADTVVGTATNSVTEEVVDQAKSHTTEWASTRMETVNVEAKLDEYPKAMARARWLKASAEAFGVKLKILVSLYQMLQGIGVTFNIQWPKVYGDALRSLRSLGSIVQIDLLQAMPIDCIVNSGFFGSLIVRTALPLLLIMLLASLSKLFRWYKKVKVASMLSSGWFVVLFLVYPSCSTAVFQAFNCDELDDGSAYLRVDYSMQCYAENKGAWSEEYKVVMAYAILMLFVYPLGTPLLYAAVLYANRVAIAKVDRLERPLMDFMNSSNTEDPEVKLGQAEHQKIRKNNLGNGGLPKLTGGYEMRVYWFEIFECVRKICLVGLPVFVEPGSSAQLIVGLLVCFISYGMYASYEPYVKDSDDWLSKVCQLSLFFSLVSSIALKLESDSSTEALGTLLLFTLAVPPMAAFLFQSGLDFEKGCYVSYIKKAAISCFTSTLGRCFDHYLREKNVVHNIEVETEESRTSAAKVSDRESAARLEHSARASSSEPVAEEV